MVGVTDLQIPLLAVKGQAASRISCQNMISYSFNNKNTYWTFVVSQTLQYTVVNKTDILVLIEVKATLQPLNLLKLSEG